MLSKMLLGKRNIFFSSPSSISKNKLAFHSWCIKTLARISRANNTFDILLWLFLFNILVYGLDNSWDRWHFIVEIMFTFHDVDGDDTFYPRGLISRNQSVVEQKSVLLQQFWFGFLAEWLNTLSVRCKNGSWDIFGNCYLNNLGSQKKGRQIRRLVGSVKLKFVDYYRFLALGSIVFAVLQPQSQNDFNVFEDEAVYVDIDVHAVQLKCEAMKRPFE